jgi:alpha-tubulin suppressor-like RCC1 family protein
MKPLFFSFFNTKLKNLFLKLDHPSVFGSLGVYVWGSGRFGQLGFEDVADKRTPTLHTKLESLMYKYLNCSSCPLPKFNYLDLSVYTFFSQEQDGKVQDNNKKQSHSKPAKSRLVQLAAGGNCTAIIRGTNHSLLIVTSSLSLTYCNDC